MDAFIPIKTDTIYLVTHAEAAGDTLTAAGASAADALIEWLTPLAIDGLYSAPSPAAQATIEPFAVARGLSITILPDLRDHRLSLQGNRPDDPYLKTRFTQRRKARPGGEPFDAASTRLRQAITAVSRRPVRAPVMVTHPGLLAALLSQKDRNFGYDDYLAMPRPGIWKLTHNGGSPTAIEAL